MRDDRDIARHAALVAEGPSPGIVEREETSARVAFLLRKQGFITFVIVGGLAAWRKAGNPLEPVPQTDLVHLPTFSR